MAELKYKVIDTEVQYFDYCNILEQLVFGDRTPEIEDEIRLVTLLIEKWDADHIIINDLNPIELLKSLMTDHKLKAVDVAGILGISKGLVSNILNYKKGLSKDNIRILAAHFKVTQDAFNQPYILIGKKSTGDIMSKMSNTDLKKAS